MFGVRVSGMPGLGVPGSMRCRLYEVPGLCDPSWVPGYPGPQVSATPGPGARRSPPARDSEEAGPPGPRRPSRPVLAPPRLTSVPAAAHSPRLLPGSALGRRRRRSEARARRSEGGGRRGPRPAPRSPRTAGGSGWQRPRAPGAGSGDGAAAAAPWSRGR